MCLRPDCKTYKSKLTRITRDNLMAIGWLQFGQHAPLLRALYSVPCPLWWPWFQLWSWFWSQLWSRSHIGGGNVYWLPFPACINTCICVFVLVYLYLCICICVLAFVYSHWCVCICVFAHLNHGRTDRPSALSSAHTETGSGETRHTCAHK